MNNKSKCYRGNGNVICKNKISGILLSFTLQNQPFLFVLFYLFLVDICFIRFPITYITVVTSNFFFFQLTWGDTDNLGLPNFFGSKFEIPCTSLHAQCGCWVHVTSVCLCAQFVWRMCMTVWKDFLWLCRLHDTRLFGYKTGECMHHTLLLRDSCCWLLAFSRVICWLPC